MGVKAKSGNPLITLAILLFLCGYAMYDFFGMGSGSVQIESVDDAKAMYASLGGTAPVPLVVFRTSWCGYCSALEKFLTENQIPYVAADIETDPKARTYFASIARDLGGGVPVTLVGTKVVPGYNPKAIVGEYLRFLEESSGEMPETESSTGDAKESIEESVEATAT